MKQKKCKVCGTEFQQARTTQSVCDWKCALELQQDKAEKKRKKEIREQKQKLKSRTEYLSEAQSSFNRYVRQRDLRLPCISCGRNHQGQWHASHYRSVKACPELRFHEANVHKSCSACNTHLSGNIVEYRIALIDKVGEDMVNWIEGPHPQHKWTIEDAKEIKAYYNKLYRLML